MKLKFSSIGMAPLLRSGLSKIGKAVAIIAFFLSMISPVYADNNGEVYYIPYDQINAWRYWGDHITDNDQQITIGTTNGNLNTHTTRTVTYYTSAMTQPEKNELYATLQAGGCTWTNPDTNTVSAVCPAIAVGGTVYSQTQEQNATTLLHEAPLMKGTVTQPTAYSTADRIFCSNGVEYLHAFWINANISGSNGTMTLHGANGTDTTVSIANTGFTDDGGIFYFRWTGNGQWNTLDIPYLNGKSYQISPIYLGRATNAGDDILQRLNITDKTVTAINNASDAITDDLVVINGTLTTTNARLNTINSSIGNMNTNLGNKIDNANTNLGNKIDTTNDKLETIRSYMTNGTSNTESAVSNNAASNSNFNTASNNYIQRENSAVQDMETGLNAISTTPDLLSSSKFVSSANWVTNQFNRIVTGTPFELVITFALVLGIALVFIGKVK